MAIIFPKTSTFDTPEGDYRVVVHEAFEKSKGTLRIVFRVLSLEHKLLVYLAGKTYEAGKAALADDLIGWLGLEAIQRFVRPDGTIDVAKLKGLHADIRIDHIHNDDYEKPFAFVSKITAPSILTPSFQSDAA